MARRFALLVVTALALGVSLVGAQSSHAYTACCGNLRLLYSNGDAFRNYDFQSQTVSSTNVDWPVTFLFYNNAEIDKVKNIMATRGYTSTGISVYGRLSDDGGATFVWDEDRGRKEGSNETIWYHYRVYANPATDRNYSPGWGYYIFGTDHGDYQECCGGWHGRSEYVEDHIAADANIAFNGGVYQDWANFYNNEPYRVESGAEGTHIWDNNGYATYVNVQ